MAFENEERVVLVDHPMVQHKLAILRDKTTPSKQFRELVRELAMFETFEVTRDLPLEEVFVETPVAEAKCKIVRGRKMAIIPILRAGLGMVEGVLDLVPAACVGHLGMERDEQTHRPREYYAKMPKDIADRDVLIVDPMLATGRSSLAAIEYLRECGVKNLKLMVLVAAPEGIRSVLDADPDVTVYTCAIDDGLNDDAYIVPGLGDAGDRIFGTK